MTTPNFLILLITIVFLSGCQNDPKATTKKLTAEELKNQLAELESVDSLHYISVKLVNFEENLIMTRSAGLFRSAEYDTDGWNITGEIESKALLARYKDVVITVSYFSQTKSLINKKDIVIYEYIKPNSSIRFTLKVNPPDGTNNISLALKSIKPIQYKDKVANTSTYE